MAPRRFKMRLWNTFRGTNLPLHRPGLFSATLSSKLHLELSKLGSGAFLVFKTPFWNNFLHQIADSSQIRKPDCRRYQANRTLTFQNTALVHFPCSKHRSGSAFYINLLTVTQIWKPNRRRYQANRTSTFQNTALLHFPCSKHCSGATF